MQNSTAAKLEDASEMLRTAYHHARSVLDGDPTPDVVIAAARYIRSQVLTAALLIVDDDIADSKARYMNRGAVMNLVISATNTTDLIDDAAAGDDPDTILSRVRFELDTLHAAGWRLEAAADILEHGREQRAATAWPDTPGG